MNYIKHIASFWYYVFKRFFENNATYRAAALTYASLLALVPFLVVVLKVVSFFPIYSILTTKAQNFLFENFVVTKSSVLHQHINSFAAQANHLPFVGSIFLIIMSITVLVTLEKIFNNIWGIKVKLHNIKAILHYWAGLCVAPLILIISLVATSILLSLPLVQIKIPVISIKILSIIPFILNVIGFSSLYYFVPNCKIKWRHALLAGLFATILFVLIKNILAWYLIEFSSYKVIYGAFAAVPIILLWFYIVWLITLLGAEVCHALGSWHVDK